MESSVECCSRDLQMKCRQKPSRDACSCRMNGLSNPCQLRILHIGTRLYMFVGKIPRRPRSWAAFGQDFQIIYGGENAAYCHSLWK